MLIEKQKIEELIVDLRSIPDLEDIRTVILSDSDNDIDFVAIISNHVSKIYFIETTADLILRYSLEFNKLITIVPLHQKDLLEHSTAFAKNVKIAMQRNTYE